MSGIFLVNADATLVEMIETPYNSEAVLQELLARYPSLLSGDAGDGTPRRWLLIKREIALSPNSSTSGTWSVDHLFLDQDAIPTIVEVKRSANTEIRRSVVGQILDYAANAVVYWPVEKLRSVFEIDCERNGNDPEQILVEFIGENESADSFWQKVATNLQAERIRLVFVADEIPAELRRVIEFLNGQMNPAEVFGVEIKQYVGGGDLRSLVPRIIGRTAEAETRKGTRTSINLTESEFIEKKLKTDFQKQVYADLKRRVQAFGEDVEIGATPEYLNFTAGRNFAEIHPRTRINGLYLLILLDDSSLQQSDRGTINGIPIRHVPGSHGFTLNHEFNVTDSTNLQDVEHLLRRSYDAVRRRSTGEF